MGVRILSKREALSGLERVDGILGQSSFEINCEQIGLTQTFD